MALRKYKHDLSKQDCLVVRLTTTKGEKENIGKINMSFSINNKCEHDVVLSKIILEAQQPNKDMRTEYKHEIEMNNMHIKANGAIKYTQILSTSQEEYDTNYSYKSTPQYRSSENR